jgi:hypothetical protein
LFPVTVAIYSGTRRKNASLGNYKEALSLTLFYQKQSDLTHSVESMLKSYADKYPKVIRYRACSAENISHPVIPEECEDHKNELPYMIRGFGEYKTGRKVLLNSIYLQFMLQSWLRNYNPWTKYSHSLERQLLISVRVHKELDAVTMSKLTYIQATLPVNMTSK